MPDGRFPSHTLSNLNDPRVLFAAERTLLACNRTALALMGLGFLVERFGLFVHLTLYRSSEPLHRSVTLVLVVAFILLGVLLLLLSVHQYRRVAATLRTCEIPEGYWLNAPALTKMVIALIGLMLAAYLALV